MAKTFLLSILSMVCLVGAVDNGATPSYIRPYEPSVEHEYLLNRLERLEQRSRCRVYDFVYFLAPGDDLVVRIDVRRDGKPDELQSKIMRVSWCRQRFSQRGMGVFSVTVEQGLDERFAWYIDFDSGAGYGLFCGPFARAARGPSAYGPEDRPQEKEIFRNTSDDGSIDIRVSAQICRTQTRLMSPTIHPLYEDDPHAEDQP
ncbi:MAG: hypothetical protein JW993_01200 [Sedimentisphaerales bacterium]|nr:hypothetical protein [Sedimentisphaerales bacterium]